jgi:hypothetical protein
MSYIIIYYYGAARAAHSEKEITIAKPKLDPRGYYRMSITITPEVHDAFKMVTAERGEKMSAVIVKLIKRYIKQYNPEALPPEERDEE